jgi:lysophospholipase L1-like esterase
MEAGSHLSLAPSMEGRIMHPRLFAFASSSALAMACAAQSHFEQVPEVYTQSPGVFRELLARARCSTVNAIMLGDSQETSPGGRGLIYIPRLQAEFWNHYGNAPATAWIPMGMSTGGTPPADWLIRTSVAAPGVVPSRLPTSFLPPGSRAISTSATAIPNINNDQRYGNLLCLQHDCANVAAATGLAGQAEYFTRSGQIALDLIAATNPSSGEVRVRVTPAPTNAPSYFQPTLATFTTSMQLEQPGESTLRSERVGPFTSWSGAGYLQVEVSGSDPSKLTDVVAARFVDLADPRGWSITSLSRGSYDINAVIANHAFSGPILAAMSPDVVILTFGANDCFGPASPSEYRTRLETLIAFVRSATRADLPIILIADPARSDLPQPNLDALDRYPGACYEIAQSDPLVLALNSRRVLDAQGWNAAGFATFLSDGVHYTPAGAIAKAAADASLLFSLDAPIVDCNTNGSPDWCDISSGRSNDANGDGIPDECACDLDFNRDENQDLLDAQQLAQVVVGLLSPEPTWLEGDINRDENVDLADAQLLARVVIGIDVCP